jgi:predicted RNA-binding protein with TRAM domain
MSHQTALKKDARNKLTPGQVLTSVVTDENIDEDGKALTKHQKITVFIMPDSLDLEFGDTVCIKIVDVQENSALAVALAKVS